MDNFEHYLLDLVLGRKDSAQEHLEKACRVYITDKYFTDFCEFVYLGILLIFI